MTLRVATDRGQNPGCSLFVKSYNRVLFSEPSDHFVLSVSSITTILLLSLGALCIVARRSRFRGTTLVAPSRWSLFAITLLLAVNASLLLTTVQASTRDAMEYLAATASFCPLMALLGAKRPQNIGWQFIVGTMWLVLILPVGEMFVLWRGGAMDVGPMRSWLLVILMFVGFTNYALTRFWFPALLATIAKSFLLLTHLPFFSEAVSETISQAVNGHFRAGSTLLGIAMIIAWWQTSRTSSAGGWDRVWTEFRNAFGLVWSLRVMERMNSTAELSDWQNELTWYGFEKKVAEIDSEQHGEVERAMRTVLRRFVSPEWIETRHGSLDTNEDLS